LNVIFLLNLIRRLFKLSTLSLNSSIFNPQSTIINPQSTIINPQSTIINPLVCHLVQERHGPGADDPIRIQAEIFLKSDDFPEGLLLEHPILLNRIPQAVQ
jgi:hypothetical protein